LIFLCWVGGGADVFFPKHQKKKKEEKKNECAPGKKSQGRPRRPQKPPVKRGKNQNGPEKEHYERNDNFLCRFLLRLRSRAYSPFEELWIVPRQIHGNDQCTKYEGCQERPSLPVIERPGGQKYKRCKRDDSKDS